MESLFRPHASWSINADFPSMLQLWGYIGHHERYQVENSNPVSPSEVAWMQWGDALMRAEPRGKLVDSLANQEEIFDALFQSMPTPPLFPDLADQPLVQELCCHHWTNFHTFWDVTGGQNEKLASQLHHQLDAVNLNRIITQCCRRVGKPIPRPFRLYLDIIYWPEQYLRHVSDEHLLLGARYLQPQRLRDFQAMLHTYIQRLV